MRINSLYISAFGGIKDLKLDFNNNFSLIYGNNENGKTTVMAFIKMMFYGSDRNSSQLSKSVRKKYTPWDGSAMAGSIDFSHSRREYRLEREFRNSNSTDKVTLWDLKTGEKQTAAADLGVKLFGLSAAAFERSIFIGQFGYPESDSASVSEINTKLSNLTLTGDEKVSFDTVSGRITKAKTALMSKSGKVGALDKNIALLRQLKERLETAEALKAEQARKTEKISALQRDTEQLIQSAADLKTTVSAEQDIRNFQKLKDYLDTKQQLDGVNASLKLRDGSLADEMFLQKLRFCLSKVSSARLKENAKQQERLTLQRSINAALNPDKNSNSETEERLTEDIEALSVKEKKTDEFIARLKEEIALLAAQKHRNLGKIFIISGLLCNLLAVVLLYTKLTAPAFIPAVLGTLLMVLSPVLYSVYKTKNEKNKQKTAELNSKLLSAEETKKSVSDSLLSKKIKLESIKNALMGSTAAAEEQQRLLAEIEAELTVLAAEVKNEEMTLINLFSRFKKTESVEEIEAETELLIPDIEKQKELKSRLSFISKDLNGISYEEARLKLDSLKSQPLDGNADFEELKRKYEQTLAQISDNKALIASLSAEAKAISAENPQELRKQAAELTEKAMEQKKFCLATDLALEILNESFADIRSSYGSKLEKTAGAVFSGLTDNRYGSMSISHSFDINVSERDVFGSREIGYLSSGTADQAYLSLRLALSQLICQEGEALPILLDDSLAQYDDGRADNAIAFLSEYSEKQQIIMFTCHSSLKASAENSGADIISITKN